jgi:multicomponent K+:H+ antiporter subunit A
MAYYKGQTNSHHTPSSDYSLLAICSANTILVLLAPWYLINEKYTLSSLLSLVTLSSFISSIIPIVLAIIIYKLLMVYKLDDRSFYSLKVSRLLGLNKPLFNNIKLIKNNQQQRYLGSTVLSQLKTFIDKKLSPQEVMPLNMQSTYVSLVIIGVCILLLVAFGF